MNAISWSIAITCIFLWLRQRRYKSRFPLPPGPPADPIIGHLRYIPSENPEDKFAEWSKKYGDVMLLHILNRKMIILNTVEAAVDLMEKRGSNYSDRPGFPIFKLMGWVPNLAFTGYNKTFQKHRRLYEQYLSRPRIVQYRSIQLRETHRLALNLLDNPDKREAMIRRFATSIVLHIAYGHEILSDDDPYVQITADSSYAITHCGPPGGTPVDLFPILQYLPSWFPGTSFAWKAREFNRYIRRLHDYPFSEVQRQMAEGTAKPSFLSYYLECLHQEDNETQEELHDIKGAAAGIYGAGTDSTWSSISIFMLAMSLYPECQLHAQQEIDAHLGGLRLPEIEDRDALPFLECVLQETYRWLNPVPLGIPHRVMQDDVYKGISIPEGSLVFANIRGISMNEAIYHDPYSFNPSRFLPKSKGGQEEPRPSAQFGFGRRICPGRHLADVNIWLAIATILSLFNVKKMKDDDGQEITPEVGMTSGLTSHPEPYKCFVQLRNDKAGDLMDQIRIELMSE